jgi:hypothetical protein
MYDLKPDPLERTNLAFTNWIGVHSWHTLGRRQALDRLELSSDRASGVPT